jgi:hypothetical protein
MFNANLQAISSAFMGWSKLFKILLCFKSNETINKEARYFIAEPNLSLNTLAIVGILFV